MDIHLQISLSTDDLQRIAHAVGPRKLCPVFESMIELQSSLKCAVNTIGLAVEAETYLYSKGKRWESCLTNTLSNSIEFIPGFKIFVRASRSSQRESACVDQSSLPSCVYLSISISEVTADLLGPTGNQFPPLVSRQ